MREQFELKYKKEKNLDQETKKFLQQQQRKKADDFEIAPFHITTRNVSHGMTTLDNGAA